MKKTCLFLLLLFLFYSCATTRSGKLKYYNITTRECNVCHRMDPVIESVEAKYRDKVEVGTYSDMSDAVEDILKKYKISRYPLNIFFDQEGKMFYKYEGILDQKAIEEILDKKLENVKRDEGSVT